MNMIQIINLGKGNFGAIDFLAQGIKLFGDSPIFNQALKFAEDNNIRGTDLYIIWSDLCNRRTDIALYTLKLAADGIIDAKVLKEASTFQDYRIKGMIDTKIVIEFMDAEVSNG